MLSWRDTLDEAIASTRNLSHELYPPVLYERALVEALRWLSHRYDEQGLLQVQVCASADPGLADQEVRAFLFQSVQELLLNAIKHGRASQASVKVGRDNGMLTITVEDNGVGADPDQMIGNSQSSGLGLFRIKERLNMLGGSLKISACIHRGCRITLERPNGNAFSEDNQEDFSIVTASRAPQGDPQSPGEPAGGRPIRVMIVDDHRMFRETLSAVLRAEQGIEVIAEAADGREAVEQAEKMLPDVILMDASMPRMDGIEATRTIRRAHPGIRIIGLSMYGKEVATSMREAGASGHLPKGRATSDLIDAIRSAWSRTE